MKDLGELQRRDRVCSAGFRTTVLPAAMAGPSFMGDQVQLEIERA